MDAFLETMDRCFLQELKLLAGSIGSICNS